MFAINKQVYSIELNSAAFDDFPRTAPTKITQIRGKIKIFTINYMVKVNSTDLCTSQFAWVCFFFHKKFCNTGFLPNPQQPWKLKRGDGHVYKTFASGQTGAVPGRIGC